MKNGLRRPHRSAFRRKWWQLIIMMLAFATANAQSDSTRYTPINSYGVKYKRHTVDSVLLMPLYNSPHTPYRAGALKYRESDSSLYKWTGTQWLKVEEGGVATNGIDTVYTLNDTVQVIETADETYFTIINSPYTEVLNGSTIIVGNDTLVITGISTLTASKLDSLHIYTASDPDPDTIYQYKSGDSSLVGYIPKGGALEAVTTDATLTGDGTAGDPLKVDTGVVATNSFTLNSIDSSFTRDSMTYNPTPKHKPIELVAAFGNSITVGVGASVLDSAYIYRIEDTLHFRLFNYALSGSGISYAVQQHHKYVSGINNPLTTLVNAGYNDANRSSTGIANKTYNKVIQGLKAMILNHYADEYVYASSSSVSRHGTWSTNQISLAGKSTFGALTSTVNDSITYTFTIPRGGGGIGVSVICGDSLNANHSSIAVYIDDVYQFSYNTNNQADNINNPPMGNDVRIPGAFFVDGLSEGLHKIKLVNEANRVMWIDYFARYSDEGKPSFILMQPLIQSATSRNITLGAKIDSLVATLPPALNVIKVPTNRYFDYNTDMAEDNIHPNDQGHRHIYEALKFSLDSVVQNSYGTLSYNTNFFVVDKNYRQITSMKDVLSRYEGNVQFAGTIGIPKGATIQQGGVDVFRTDSLRFNTIIGQLSGTALTTGTRNTSIGHKALEDVTTGGGNTAVGNEALTNNTTGSNNTAVGLQAIQAGSGGSRNSAFGGTALKNVTASDNTAVGYLAGELLTSGASNVYFGVQSGRRNQTGSFNVAVGATSLQGATGSHSRNTVIGAASGAGITTGNNNIFLGYRAGENVTTGSNNLLIGYDIDLPSSTTSNYLSIGNLIFASGTFNEGTTISGANIGIAKASPALGLDINKQVGITKDSVPRVGALTNADVLIIDTANNGQIKRIPGSVLTGAAQTYYNQFVNTEAVTVNSTATETTIYGNGEGSATIDGDALITAGTKIVFKGAGTIDTDDGVAGPLIFAFKLGTAVVQITLSSELPLDVVNIPYEYEVEFIPISTGSNVDVIIRSRMLLTNLGTPILKMGNTRLPGALTTTGSVVCDVTVDWDSDAVNETNKVQSNYNTIEIFKK